MITTRLLATMSLPAFAILAASPAFAGEVVGTVIDASQTVALRAAEVRIVELGRVATTNADGGFYLADVPAGDYTLEVRYVGAETVRQPVSVPETGEVDVTITVGVTTGREILVIGQSANLASALSRKRSSDTVSDVLTRDAIGQFPDQNVAESMRRLPGINILNDQGEGRFVSIRGLDPELNSTSLNGVRLPAPESDVRSVALDVVSSDIIESIEVKKSLTPDMDADTIGASVEIETTSAFARRKDLLAAKLEGSYNEYSGEVTPKGSFDFATKLSDTVGISGGVSYYKRKFETDNIEADDWVDADGGVFPLEVQYRDYDVERERISGTLGLDFKVGDNTELYVKSAFSQFDDQEYRRRTTFDLGDFEDDGPSSFDGVSATFSDADQEFTVERDIKDRFERQRIWSVVAGGETHSDGWHLEYLASYARASEKEAGSVDPAQFERDFEDDGVVVGFDYADPRVPLYSVAGNVAAFADPAGYGFKDIELTALSDAQDEEWSAKFDIGREMFLGSATFTVQAGFKGRWREKSYAKDVEFYEIDDYTLADVFGEQTYRITDIGPVADFTSPTRYFFDNFDQFELQDIDTQFDSATDDYAVSEDIMAGYLLGRYENAALRVIGGVRYEGTSNDISGNLVTLIEEGGTLPDSSIADDDTVIVMPVSFEKDYDDWLPSLNVRYEAQPDLILRVAGYKSLVRPKLSKLAPRFIVEENDEGEREGEFGNPALKPYKAWNFDASAEYYFGRNAALTAAVFYKDIENYIVDTVREDDTFNGIAFTEAVIPINGPSAEVWGIELGFSKAFTELPAPFDGLLVQANYTYTDASGMVPIDGDAADLRKISLPSTSKHTANATLGYEKGPFSIRLAGTYRDKYLDELGDEADFDRYVDDHFQLDLSAKYRVSDMIQLYYEWVNINDAKYFAYNTFGGGKNLYQYERYNWTMKFGARLTF
ncbi:TonB-dependent receptor [Alteriqipengyuania flavescens]|uniref:TonB-dependent receptor n=1 Tax=Alteriqipengyuania flavescens TaxID=3053610 RepID=UPI0025B356BB|nr:TonB-dependent receptor [Alteriqipengyuania flavescens]WJY19934.1 TonB-dependent receptor [Alteriqipengyuania flavescens]WJY25878.1 TonB-dependent receptor [Alteriqipengyuania flavescens]